MNGEDSSAGPLDYRTCATGQARLHLRLIAEVVGIKRMDLLDQALIEGPFQQEPGHRRTTYRNWRGVVVPYYWPLVWLVSQGMHRVDGGWTPKGQAVFWLRPLCTETCAGCMSAEDEYHWIGCQYDTPVEHVLIEGAPVPTSKCGFGLRNELEDLRREARELERS